MMVTATRLSNRLPLNLGVRVADLSGLVCT